MFRSLTRKLLRMSREWLIKTYRHLWLKYYLRGNEFSRRLDYETSESYTYNMCRDGIKPTWKHRAVKLLVAHDLALEKGE
jgi:hypothetical protein